MKILFLANNGAGLYNFRHELIEELVKSHEVYVCLPEGRYVDELKAMGCSFIPCNFNRHGMNPIKELQTLRFYKKLLDDLKPDVALTYTIKPNAYGGMACASRKVPFVANVTGLGTAATGKGLINKVTLALYKRGLRKAQRVFFQNRSDFDAFVNRLHIVNPSVATLIPGSGVNLRKFTVLPWPEGEKTEFTYVGRMMKQKGIDLYLDAAEQIHAKHPDTVFHICGMPEAEWEPNMERVHALEKQGVVLYHGRVDPMSDIYRVVSCVLHPSYYPEGMSNVLLESCASGRPAVTTDLPGRREIIENGVNGYVIRPKDSADLVRAVEDFLTLPAEKRREMGLSGRAKVEREFDRRIVVDAYLDEVRKAGKH